MNIFILHPVTCLLSFFSFFLHFCLIPSLVGSLPNIQPLAVSVSGHSKGRRRDFRVVHLVQTAQDLGRREHPPSDVLGKTLVSVAWTGSGRGQRK